MQGCEASWTKNRNLISLKSDINRMRGVFKFAFDERLIERPIYYGQSFDRPSKKTCAENATQVAERSLRLLK